MTSEWIRGKGGLNLRKFVQIVDESLLFNRLIRVIREICEILGPDPVYLLIMDILPIK